MSSPLTQRESQVTNNMEIKLLPPTGM